MVPGRSVVDAGMRVRPHCQAGHLFPIVLFNFDLSALTQALNHMLLYRQIAHVEFDRSDRQIPARMRRNSGTRSFETAVGQLDALNP